MRFDPKDGPRFNNNASKSFLIMFRSGVEGDCKFCNKYGILDKFGYCEDLDCRADRLVLALVRGEAQKLKDGTLVWLVAQ